MATHPWEIQMCAVPSHPIPWDDSHGNPIPMDKPEIIQSEKVFREVHCAAFVAHSNFEKLIIKYLQGKQCKIIEKGKQNKLLLLFAFFLKKKGKKSCYML